MGAGNMGTGDGPDRVDGPCLIPREPGGLHIRSVGSGPQG